MKFDNRNQFTILSNELNNESENIAMHAIITLSNGNINTKLDSSAGSTSSKDVSMVTGIVIMNLYSMIENSCHIIRNELDIISNVDNSVLGSLVVDIRGYQLLQKCG